MHPSALAAKVRRRLARTKKRLRKRARRDPNRFLRRARGVIHVGANVGQERDLYASFGLPVLWVEPNHDVFEQLSANLAGYDGQRALERLVTDRDDASYDFHIASNNGGSSSILELKGHADMWPEVSFTRTVTVQGVTLATLFERESLDPAMYDTLIMDTQGSELLVLKGAEPLLGRLRFIKTEVADFESYEGCCVVDDIEAFLSARGFAEISRRAFKSRPGIGNYYDIVYARS